MGIRFEGDFFGKFLDETKQNSLSHHNIYWGSTVFSCKEIIFLADHIEVLVSPVMWVILHTEQQFQHKFQDAQLPKVNSLDAERGRKEKLLAKAVQ